MAKNKNKGKPRNYELDSGVVRFVGFASCRGSVRNCLINVSKLGLLRGIHRLLDFYNLRFEFKFYALMCLLDRINSSKPLKSGCVEIVL